MRTRSLICLTALAVLLGAVAAPATGAAPAAPAAPAVPTAAPTAVPLPPCSAGPFSDVAVDHPFCAEIAWLAAEGLSQGYADGTFRPTAATSRQALASFLADHAGVARGCDAARFTDVTAASPFCGAITWLAQTELTTGYGDGTFRPADAVTRQAAVAFLARYAAELTGEPVTTPCSAAPFPDVPVGHPFCAEIAWAAAVGITTGYGDGTFRPAVVVSRQATAAFLARTDGLGTGFVDYGTFTGRQDDYLAFATTARSESSPINLLLHLERARRDPGFTPVATDVGPDAFQGAWDKIDGYQDTADFDMLYLLNLWYGYADELDPDLRARIESAMLDFEYWYTDPTPAGTVDDRWYWSENHRIIFHALEYLAGQAFPTETFTVTGLTGAEHMARAQVLIDEWLEEKARFGFSEWHSDVYYQKDVTPLLTLVEFAEDRDLAERASMILDLVLSDLALHTLDGNNGATHGRSYMKDKSIAPDQDVFGVVKLLFDDTSEPYRSTGDAGAGLLARARRYRVPEIVRRMATADVPMVDVERMNIPSGVEGPLVAHPSSPTEPYGFDYDDPANIPFWWERGALTAWPVVPTTLDTIEAYDLWDSPSFADFVAIRDIVKNPDGTYNYPLAQTLAYNLRDLLNIGLLDEVTTYTYRSGDAMLSSALDYRPGANGSQYHAWQATLSARAVVFTTHPANLPRNGSRWVDGDRYWTGTASMPRSAQQGSAGIHIYAPAYESQTTPPLDAFGYLDETHAWFPTEEFDEVVQSDGWTFGRKDGGYVALWSWRPTTWRTHAPEVVNQNGLTEDYDLVATGGADNVWLVEVADAADWSGDFGAFQAAMVASAPSVTETDPTADLPHGGFDVAWTSPSQGALSFGSTAPFLVGGSPVDLRGAARYDNPWMQVPFDSSTAVAGDGDVTLDHDYATWERTACSPFDPRC